MSCAGSAVQCRTAADGHSQLACAGGGGLPGVGLRVLLLIDATGLWSDELYSVGKSFQPRFSTLLAMLREDTHPPAYYALLWLWGIWWARAR